MSRLLIVVAALCMGAVCYWAYRKKCYEESQKHHSLESYEPQNMGSRKYFGWGREYGSGQWDTHDDRYFCYPASLREFWQCLPGYSLHKDTNTGFLQCCVNEMNY